MACVAQHRKMPTLGEERQASTPRTAAKQRACGRPTQELAGDHPDEWQAAVFFQPGARRQVLPATPLRAKDHIPDSSRVWTC